MPIASMIRLVKPILGLCLVCSVLGAREKFDLERVTPVPSSEPVPMLDFFRPPLFRNATMNQAGTHVAALVAAAEDRTSLMVADLEKGTIETLKGSGDRDVYSYTWLDDKRLIATLSSEKLYGLGLLASEVGQLDRGYPILQYTAVSLVSVPPHDRLHPLVWVGRGLEEGNDDIGVSQIDTGLNLGGIYNLMAAGSSDADFEQVRERNRKHIRETYPTVKDGIGGGSYLADRLGALEFCVTSARGFRKLHQFKDKKWRATSVDLDEFSIVDVGNEPGQMVVLPRSRTGKPMPLQFLNVETGQLGDVLIQDKGYDVDATLFRDPETGVILGATYERAGPQVVWFDESLRAIQKTLEASYPGQVVRIRNIDRTGRMLIAVRSDRQPAIYYRVDLAKKAVSLIKNSAPWIDPKRMQPMNIIKFKTRDGFQLDAYLTLPAGASKKSPPPLVVMPHGGPWVRDVWGFDSEAQFLASRGYAVLQPNYRGSTGYDWMFPEEDRWAFRKMHDDVTDATKTVIAGGLVDPERVAIAGASFGAYLSITGVAHEPKLYRCAVAMSGVFDWATVLAEEKYFQYWSDSFGYLVRRLGDPKKEKEKYAAISALRYANQIQVPVFVAHGKEDRTADIGESKRLIAELDKYHVPHEDMFVRGEGHGMAYLKDRIELYSRVEAFLAKNLAPKTAAVAVSGTP